MVKEAFRIFSMSMKNRFKKSFVEPAMSKFRNQIAPQIQQSYIASGQHRGTGLDDTLTRAGVDMDAMLNQYLFQAQQQANQNKMGVLDRILGMDFSNQRQMGGASAAGLGALGFLKEGGLDDAFKEWLKPSASTATPGTQWGSLSRKGFAQ